MFLSRREISIFSLRHVFHSKRKYLRHARCKPNNTKLGIESIVVSTEMFVSVSTGLES